MRTKVTLFLLFLNVALFAFIYYFDQGDSSRAKLEASRRPLGPESANLLSIEIAGKHLADPVYIYKRVDGWHMARPFDWPANPHAINSILYSLQSLEHESFFLVADLAKNNQSLADYGLENPAITIVCTPAPADPKSQPPAPFTLKIGDSTKVGNRLYLLSPDGTRIHVVKSSLADSIALPIEQLRADTLFSIPVFEARSFILQSAASGVPTRIRHDGPSWRFETPFSTRASPAAVENTINSLNTLGVRSFENAKTVTAESAGLNVPTYRITLDGNGRRETLLIGGVPPGVAKTTLDEETVFYAKVDDRSPIITVALPAPLLRTLRNIQDELRDRHLLAFDKNQVSTITISAPGKSPLELVKLESGAAIPDAAQWQIMNRGADKGPQVQSADSKVVNQFIDKLTQLSAVKFVSDAPQAIDLETWGFNRPEREITLQFTGTTGTPVTLQIGVAAEKQSYAKEARAASIFLIDPGILTDAETDPLAFRNRLIHELPAGTRITGITLSDISTQSVVISKQLSGDETWDTALASETPERKKAVLALLEGMRALRAQKFISERFSDSVEILGEKRPWKYKLEASLALQGGAGGQTGGSSTLVFSERAGGTLLYAGSQEHGIIFETEQNLLDGLFTLTFGALDTGAKNPAIPAQP